MANGYDTKMYDLLWRNRHLTEHCDTILEMADALSEAAAGVVLEGGQEDDYARLVATRFGLREVEEFEGD